MAMLSATMIVNVHFEQNYPQSTEVRTTKLNHLKLSYQATGRIIVKSATQQEQTMEALPRVAWVLRKHKKLFLDGKIIREWMSEVMDAMHKGKQKNEIIQK